MTPREFLRLDLKVAVLTAVLAILSVVSMGSGYRLVPCQLTPLAGGEAVDSTCSLAMLMGNLIGSVASMTPLSYVVLFLLVVAVPYLIACIVRAVALKGT